MTDPEIRDELAALREQIAIGSRSAGNELTPAQVRELLGRLLSVVHELAIRLGVERRCGCFDYDRIGVLRGVPGCPRCGGSGRLQP